MKDSKEIRALPAILAAVGAVAGSTALFALQIGTDSGLPWITAPLLAVIIYSGALMLTGRSNGVNQWLTGLMAMLGVHLCLGIVSGIVFFFARPKIGQTECLRWAILGYGPAVALQVLATLGICQWVPRLMGTAAVPVSDELPKKYETKNLGRSTKATMHLRADMMERISTASRHAVELEEPVLEDVPIKDIPSEEELLAEPANQESEEFELQTGGKRFRVVNGKLVSDQEEKFPEPVIPETAAQIVERIPQVAREMPWEGEEIADELEVRIPSAALMDQIPDGCIAVPVESRGIMLRFPQRLLAPQLAEGCVWVPAGKALSQLPSDWLLRPAAEIVQAIEDGYLELPLKDVVDQMPWSAFVMPSQKPPRPIPGSEWGDLFTKAA